MRFRIILNRDSGRLRTIDLKALTAEIRALLREKGHAVDIAIVSGRAVATALAEAASCQDVDVVMAGGGDGTASAAAGCVRGTRKALAVLPAGTMNLFARSLRIPLALDQAVRSFAEGHIRTVDIASANGRPFVHQFSVGMHARLVELRSRMEFSSRIGKMRASLSATLDTIRNPVSVAATLTMGETEILTNTAGISVSNNLYGEGHLPFADRPDGALLGIYVANARRRRELLLLCLNIAIGRWRDNGRIEIHQSDSLVLTINSVRRARGCVIDGELCPLEKRTVLKIHPRALNVLVPVESWPAEDSG